MNILFIPSALLVNEELKSQFGEIPSVLVPLESKTILDHLYDKYYDHVDKIAVIASEKSELIIEYKNAKGYDIEVLILDNIKDLGYTIYFALDYYKSELDSIENLIINFGDTIVYEDVSFNFDYAMFSNTVDSKRWTTFEFNECKINKILDKQITSQTDIYNVFIGLFNFKHVRNLYEIYEKVFQNKKDIIMDSFFETLMLYNNCFDINFINTDNWFDAGHIDRYFSTSKDVKTRYFNTITIDKQRGILTKKSKNKIKFIKEILWYLKLPGNLQYMSPRVFSYSLDYEKPYVTMEYYSYNNLHDIFLYGNYELYIWKKIFNALFNIIIDMQRYRVHSEKFEIQSSILDMYVVKTVQRLNTLREDDKFKGFFDNPIRINNNEYESLNTYMEATPGLVEKYCLSNQESLCIIHGDLCFSNILYDSRNNLVRIIDPRGEFGSFDIYGDPRYDFAKLSHSIEGKYDFIIADLFKIDVDGENLRYTIFDSNVHKQIQELYLKKLSEFIQQTNSVRFIEALLFLSMIPLHKDFPLRQYMMMAIGVELFDVFFKGENNI